MIEMISELRHFTRKAKLIACCCAITLVHPSLAAAEDFFISTQADFNTHRQAILAPGDQVLFERGSVFNGMFAPSAVGTANNVIRISTFGTGPRPIIHNNGVIHPHPTRAGETISAGVFLHNPEYVELEGLEITNNNGGDQDDEDLIGIYVLSEDTNKYHNHIYIRDNYVHHVNGAVEGKRRGGIHVHGYSPDTPSRTATYNDLRIEHNVVDQVGGVGIGTDVDNIVDAHDFVGTSRENAITNLYVAHNWIGNTGRNSVIARDADYAVYEYNTSANSSRYSTGHSFFNFKTLGIVWQYNEAYGNVSEAGGQVDRGGFDADYNSRDTTIQYNYSHDNDWFVGIMKRPNADVIIRHNLSVNDGGAYHYGFENDSDLINLHCYNNTHYFRADTSPELIPLGRTPLETTINNNIFYAESSATAGPNADNGINVTFDTNGYFNVTPPDSETNPLFLNPQLVSPGAVPRDVDMEFGRDVLNGYRLAANSPYHNSGIPIPDNGGMDFWGQPLTSNTLGASQYDANIELSPGATLMTNSPMSNVNSQVAVATLDQASLGDDAEVSLSQTFQIDSTFELNTILLGYEYDPNADSNHSLINVEIFEVEDVAAADLVHGTSLLTITGLVMPQNAANSDESAIVLDSPLTLEATTGTKGYALRITNGKNPGFEWLRTGSSSASVYASGQAYEDGDAKQSGDRDFVLALSSDFPDVLTDLLGDFNLDGEVTCDDLDGYVGNLGATVTAELAPLDLDNDGTISAADTNTHITTLVQTSNGRTGTFPGDLNCDGSVDVLSDAFALIANLGNSVTRYSQGDINFDGTVNVLGDAFILIGSLGSTNDS